MSKILIGKTINSMQIAEDKKALLFKTTDGDIIAKTDGDCCSDSWVENVELPALGFPAKVIDMQDLDLPGIKNPNEDGEVTEVYGCKITTDKGEIIIDYRNSSNGYYGGDLLWPDDNYFYGGVYGQNISKQEWVDI